MNKQPDMETITLICIECGYSQDVGEHEVPRGPCRFCKDGYGWIEFPKRLVQKGFQLMPGDEVFIATKEYASSENRIVEIRRGGLVIYNKNINRTVGEV